MDTVALRKKLLDLALRGRLVAQDPNDEPAEKLVERIRLEKERLVAEGKIKRDKNPSRIYREGEHWYEVIGGNEPVCIDDQLPFKIPDGWTWSRLNECCSKEVKRGKSPKYAESGQIHVFAQKCNTKYNGINIELSLCLDESYSVKYPSTEFMQNGDIVVNSTGTGTLGRVGFFKDSDNPNKYPLVPDSHVTIIRSSKFLVREYIYATLKLNEPLLEKLGEGSTNQKELKPLSLMELFVPIPPFKEQKRITDKLESFFCCIDEIEQKKKSLSCNLSAIKTKSLDLAVRGQLVPQDPNDEPAEKLIERIRQEKDRLVSEGKIKRNKKPSRIYREGEHWYEVVGDNAPVCIDDQLPFEIPDGWTWSRLNECCSKEIKRGKSPKYAENGHVHVFAQKCNTKYNGMNVALSLCLDESYSVKYPFTEFMQNGDIVVNSTGTGTLGRVGFFKDSDNPNKYPLVPDSHVTIVRCSNFLVREYIYAALKLNEPLLEKLGEGSTNQKELKPLSLMELFVPIPPFQEQKRIVDKLEKIFSLVQSMAS